MARPTPVARDMGSRREPRGRRKDASVFPVEIGPSPLPARRGEPAQVAVSIRDTTQRKEQDAALKQAKVEPAALMKSSAPGTIRTYPIYSSASATPGNRNILG